MNKPRVGRQDVFVRNYVSEFATISENANEEIMLAGLRALNRMVEGTNLPRLQEDQIEAMIHRDSLQILGLE